MLNIFISNTGNSDRSKFYFGLIAVLIMTAGFFLSVIQVGNIHTDGGIFSAVALKDLNGGTLYNDAWENKPPAIFFLTELFLTVIPDHVMALFIMPAVAFAATAICLYILIYRYIGSFFTSTIFTVLTLYFTIHKNNIGDGLYTEIYGFLFILISMVFSEQYSSSKKNYNLYLSAFSLGISPWFKEPFILLCLPLILIAFRQLQSIKIKSLYLFFCVIPGLMFLLILFFNGALSAYADTLKYNLSYISSEEKTSVIVKLNEYRDFLIMPVFALFLLFCLMSYKTITNEKTRNESLLYLVLLALSVCFVLLSPHNFGHYYYPSFVLFFLLTAKIWQLFTQVNGPVLKLPLLIICLYYIYSNDQWKADKMKFQITPYKPDKIVSFLRGEKGKTLFVEYVVKSDYYIKSGLIYPTWLPVGLPVHFLETEQGRKNRKRIWDELNRQKPDYLITTNTPSYFSWFLPDPGFYEKNYIKTDSILAQGELPVYLWKLK